MSFSGNPSAQADKIYFDMTYTNVDSISTAPKVCSFTETRTTPILLRPEEYYCSIVRYQLETATLPVFIPIIQYNSSDVNASIYSFTLEWVDPSGGTYTSGQTYMSYAPQNLAAQVPSPPSSSANGLQNNNTTYYNVYNIQYAIYLFNQTLTTAFAALVANAAASSKTLPTTNAPVISISSDNGSDPIFVLNCDLDGYDTTATSYIRIYCNQAMYQLFSAFPAYYLSDTASAGKNIQIQTTTFGGVTVTQFPSWNPTYNAIQVFGSNSTISAFSPITSIVFASNTMPVVPNQISAPLLSVNGLSVSGNNGNNNNISQILTDFISPNMQYQPVITYEPTAQYRLISMLGNQPLSKIDVSVFWVDIFGNQNPLYLASGSTLTIKFLFTKKSSMIDKSAFL